jgi:general secretion pathway protein D
MVVSCAFAFGQFDFGGGPGGGGSSSSQPWDSFKLNSKTKIKLDFKNASIDMVLTLLSKTSGITIVKDPNLTGNISISSPKAVPLSEAFTIVNSLLNMKGYDVKKEGNHLVVKGRATGRNAGSGSNASVPSFDPSMFTSMMGANQTEIKVYPLKYASASAVATVLNDVFATQASPMDSFMQMFGGPGQMGRGGMQMGNRGRMGSRTSSSSQAVRASSDVYSNSVIVNASSTDQEQVYDLIKQIDKQTDTPQQSKVFTLKFAMATDLVTIVQNVLTANAPTGRGQSTGSSSLNPFEQRFQMFGSRSSSSSSTVTADSRTNSLIVTTTEENMKLVENLIKDLDTEVKYESTTFVYPLSNARADLLATTLNQAFNNTRSGTTNSTSNRTSSSSRTSSSRNSSSSSNRLSSENVDPNNIDPNNIDIALADPAKDNGELLTQIFAQGYGGGGYGQRSNTNSNSTTKTTGRTADGRVVSIRDLSGQVTIVADTNTNSLIIVTMPENVALIKQILEQLDKIPEQVMIETIIVEATLDATDKFGVEWNFTENNIAGDKGNTGTMGTTYNLKSNTSTLQGFKYTMTGGNLTAFMNILKTDQKFRVLSTPRIFTSNNSEAEINISQSIPYVLSQRTDANGNITFDYSFEDVGIVLTVTPHITADGFVTMDVTQTANDLQGYTSFNAPIVNQRQATTNVAVKDGETIILGGIIRNTVNSTVNKIPVLGDIPLLGELFKSTTKENVKTELLVFLTPRVVRTPEEARKLAQEQQNKLSIQSQKELGKVLPPTKPDDKGKTDDKNLGGSK